MNNGRKVRADDKKLSSRTDELTVRATSFGVRSVDEHIITWLTETT